MVCTCYTRHRIHLLLIFVWGVAVKARTTGALTNNISSNRAKRVDITIIGYRDKHTTSTRSFTHMHRGILAVVAVAVVLSSARRLPHHDPYMSTFLKHKSIKTLSQLRSQTPLKDITENIVLG